MSNRRAKSVTLRDVAKRVGVSAMTVSRALSDKAHLVSSETAEQCRTAAAELGYVPNLMARSLRGEQLRTIVMFAEFISSHHYLAELVDVASRSIEERGYSVINCQSLPSFHQALRNFNLGGAVVIAPPESFYDDPFGERRIGPVSPPATVLIHSAVEQNDFSEVSPDIAAFSYHAACHLIELGHEQLAYLGGPRADDEPHWFELRRRGIAQALQECGLPEKNLVHQGCLDVEGGAAALQQLLNRKPNTTAIMCINDEIAIAAIAGAADVGIATPGDLSIMGCNDIRLARFFQPRLSTLAINVEAMVNTGLDILFDDVLERTRGVCDPIKIRLPANLIIRDSTGPPRKRRAT